MASRNPLEYYSDEEFHGEYQYVTLKDIINTFMVRYVGDNEEINNIARHRVIFEAKRGLKELNYDALKEVKAIELDLNENLEITMPHDYVNYARVSWVDELGNLRPIIESKDTGIVSAYLQDNNFEILFDSEGFPLKGTSETFLGQQKEPTEDVNFYKFRDNGSEYSPHSLREQAKYSLDTSRANFNGEFYIDKNNGKMRFSSDLPVKTIVLEYISDGLESEDPSKVRIHKFAERALYAFIKYEILNNRLDSTEYRIRRAKQDYLRERQNASIRLSNLKPHQFIQRIKGRRKWLK